MEYHEDIAHEWLVEEWRGCKEAEVEMVFVQLLMAILKNDRTSTKDKGSQF